MPYVSDSVNMSASSVPLLCLSHCPLWTVVLSQGDLNLADALGGGDDDDSKPCKYNRTQLTCLNVKALYVCGHSLQTCDVLKEKHKCFRSELMMAASLART